MKKNLLIIGFAGMLGLSSGLISCSPDYETDFRVESLVVPDKSQAPIVFPRNGGEHEIEVQTNVEFGKWQATSNAEWCQVKAESKKVVVSANENDIYKQRTAEITIAYGHQSYSITVTQFGKEPAILVGEEMVRDGYVKTLEPELTTVTIPVATNMELDNIIIPDTCSWIRLPEGGVETIKKNVQASEGVENHNITFDVDPNTDLEVRYCMVTLQSSQNYNYITTFIIKQMERGYIVEIDEDKKVIETKAMGETITIPFQINGPADSYTFEVEEAAKGWITPVNSNRVSSRAMRDVSESFIIAPNTDKIEEPRQGTITFTSTDPKKPNSFVVTVKQAGFIPVPPANVTNVRSIPEAGRIRLEWDVPEEVDYKTLKITFHDKVINQDREIVIDDYNVTSAVIDDTYACAGEYDITFTTYGPTGMATETPVEIQATSNEAPELERVTLTIDMLSDNHGEPQEGRLGALVDNSTGTGDFYHTIWSASTSDAHWIQIKLNKPLQNIHIEYDGRRGGDGGGDVKRALIMGSHSGNENDWERMGTVNFNMPTQRGGHATPTGNVSGRTAYNYIRFIPEARRSKDPINNSWWNMAKFYLFRVRHDEAWAKEQLGM